MEKVNTKKEHENPATKSLSSRELSDTRQVINNFLLAWKNYGLYPEDHESTIKSFQNLVTSFSIFFESYGNLRLTVEKDCLICKSEIVHKISQDAPREDITTLLYRDGIKWVEFKKGLSLEEIASFFRIAFKYRFLAEEIEGDIVTALMDEELEYLDFKAVDIFWQDLMLMNFSQLPPPAAKQEDIVDHKETDQNQKPVESVAKDNYAISIADPSISNTQLELSNNDDIMLQLMVTEEESWDITDNLFELLLVILKKQTEPDKFTSVLNFISEITVEIIELEKFNLLAKLFKTLHKLLSSKGLAGKDYKNLLIQFFRDLSRPEIFQLISKKLLKVQTSEIEKLEALRKALVYFSPEFITFLVPVMMQRSSKEIQQLVSGVIIKLSKRDIGPLEKIVNTHGHEMGDKLMNILSSLEGERVDKILLKMCEYPSEKVRIEAINKLVERDPKYTLRLFSLIDDPDKNIRTCILEAFAKNKSSVLEKKLMNYLRENMAKKDSNHIIACYKALGQCGSNMSLPFLQEILLNRGWNSIFGSGKPVFREGAAIALALLDIPEAKDVLRKASKSRFKIIRKAFDKTKNINFPG